MRFVYELGWEGMAAGEVGKREGASGQNCRTDCRSVMTQWRGKQRDRQTRLEGGEERDGENGVVVSEEGVLIRSLRCAALRSSLACWQSREQRKAPPSNNHLRQHLCIDLSTLSRPIYHSFDIPLVTD